MREEPWFGAGGDRLWFIPRPAASPAPASDSRRRSARVGQSGCGRIPVAGSIIEPVPPLKRNVAGPVAGRAVPDRELRAVASGRAR